MRLTEKDQIRVKISIMSTVKDLRESRYYHFRNERKSNTRQLNWINLNIERIHTSTLL
jgi:hypothetical protein